MKLFLRLEQAVLFLLTFIIYFCYFNFSWGWFVGLLFIPDLSIIGYLVNNKLGAYIYNSIHNLILPSLLLILARVFDTDILLMISLVLFAHIFMDRTLGFGLKYTDQFNHTHLD